MAFDILSAGVGFLVGVLATALALEFGVRRVRNPETSKLTSAWSLNEVARMEPPRVVAEKISNLRVPKGSRVVVLSGGGAVSGDVLQDANVRMHPDVRANFALGGGKALVFTSNLHPKAMAVSTHDGTILTRLTAEFDRLWDEGEAYVERVAINELAGKDNVDVEVRGTVSAVMDYRGGKMLRLTEGGHTVGVLVRDGDPESLKGQSVRVVGRFRREEGYSLVDARTIETVAKARPSTGRA